MPAAPKKPAAPRARARTQSQVKAAPAKTKSKEEFKEEFKVASDQVVGKVKELIKEGNIRRIIIKQKGKVVLELPMTLAAVGVFFAPVLAAIGAFAALATDCTLEVERKS